MEMKKLVLAASMLAAVNTLASAQSTNDQVFTLKDLGRIVDASRGNEIRFNRDFKGRWFRDTLVLKSISEGWFNSGYRVTFQGVDCRVNATEADALVDWSPVKRVQVTGRIKTTSMGDLQLESCSFAEV
jgi:hypothetical protein